MTDEKNAVSSSRGSSDLVSEKIRFILRHYKDHFAELDLQEHYKWKAIDWYRQKWDLSVPLSEFPTMVETALGESGNLLAARMYYAYPMATEFARDMAEKAREAFLVLYDESRPLAERYEIFRRGFDSYVKPLGKNHYQDLHAISVYLTFEYPNRYFFYKYSIYNTFCARVGYYEEKPTRSSSVWRLEANNRLHQRILEEIQKDPELLELNQKRAAEFHTYNDSDLHILAADIAFYGANYMQESDFALFAASDEPEELAAAAVPENSFDDTVASGTDIPLNTILYGPPGTGKTYYTVIYAVAIIEDKELDTVRSEPYSEVIKRYNRYKENHQIAFTTFHQSYGYEEFIEGIKPDVLDDDSDGSSSEIRYKVSSGIFKSFCERARQATAASAVQVKDFGMNSLPNIWKVSLEGTGDNPTRTECLKNGHIRIGWDEYKEKITDQTDFFEYGGKNPLNAFINRMQIGDVVLSCYSASTIDAIGVITGDYEWHNEYKQYKRLRKVNWIVKNIQENILESNGGVSMTLATVYRMSNITLADVYRMIEKHSPKAIQPSGTSPASPNENRYVFIIDEINRGNISKIFGELITLIEPSKREGQPEGILALLPYSQKPFGVPKNVYLIGTMNTADRSVTALDTALRRRFSFREMLPDPKLLSSISVEGMSIREMLSTMNQRIAVLYDREHTIGHAYFIPLKDDPSMETLGRIFEDKVFPLLQEYFFDDYGKIRLVLGDNRKPDPSKQFIQAESVNYSALFGDAEIGTEDDCLYRINSAAFYDPEAYLSICLSQGQSEDEP